MLENKVSIISLVFLSYNNFSLKKNKLISKRFNKIILIFWLIKKYNTITYIKFLKIKILKKYFVLLTSPKNYKRGKVTLNYQYFKYVIIIKKISSTKTLNNYFKYFHYFLNMFKLIENSYLRNNKIKLRSNVILK